MIALLANRYVLAAIAVLLLLATGYGLYERGNAAISRAESAETRAAELTESLRQSEEDKARLRALSDRLDAAVKERDARYAALQKAKKDLDGIYAKLRNEVAQADQACLDRDLPDSFRERLQ